MTLLLRHVSAGYRLIAHNGHIEPRFGHIVIWFTGLVLIYNIILSQTIVSSPFFTKTPPQTHHIDSK